MGPTTGTFDKMVMKMMRKWGGVVQLVQPIGGAQGTYDPSTGTFTPSPPIVTDIKAMFFDLLKPKDGIGQQSNTLVQEGDKQIFLQPPQKADNTASAVTIQPNRDMIIANGITYKIMSLKELNPSMSPNGQILFEAIVRV